MVMATRPQRRSPVPLDIGHLRHGTVTGYRAGCGCSDCTRAKTEAQARWTLKCERNRRGLTLVLVTCDACTQRFRARAAQVQRLGTHTLRLCRSCVTLHFGATP